MKRILVTVAALLITSVAFADDESNIFAGIGATFSDYGGEESSQPPAQDLNDSNVGVQVYVQGKINSWFGVEAGYYSSGNFSGDTNASDEDSGFVNTSLRGFNASTLFFVPIFPNAEQDIDLFARVGLYEYDIDRTSQDGNQTTPGSLGHESGLLVGGGFVLNVTDSLGIRTEFNWYDISNAELWSLNMGVQFGF